MITDEFRQTVRDLREQGLSWPKVSRAAGRPIRTCQRALEPDYKPGRTCRRRGCTQPATLNGNYCPEHGRERMRNKPGHGPRQQQVMRLMRAHGHMTSEQVRNATGMDASLTGQVMLRLTRLGLIERPMRGHYTLADHK